MVIGCRMWTVSLCSVARRLGAGRHEALSVGVTGEIEAEKAGSRWPGPGGGQPWAGLFWASV